MATKKITELTELAVASDEDLIPIVDVSDGETKKIQAKRIGAGGIAGDTVPIGTIMPYSGSEEPVNWIICDGRELNRSEYEDLFTIIGTTYGEGDGSTTFNIPNLKGKIPVGFDSEDEDFNAVGKTGGEKTHTLTIEEMPKHRHGIRTSSGSGGQVDNMPWGAGLATQTTNTEYTGGNQPHNNMQPYLVQKYIIKAFQSAGVVANILNVKSESTVDTYSCDYINDSNSSMTIYATSRQSYSMNRTNGIKVSNLTLNNNIGNKLTYNDSSIIIGTGVTKVLASATISFWKPSTVEQCQLLIRKNGKTAGSAFFETSSDQYTTDNASITPILIEVEEGDILDLALFGSGTLELLSDNTGTVHLTVEVKG